MQASLRITRSASTGWLAGLISNRPGWTSSAGRAQTTALNNSSQIRVWDLGFGRESGALTGAMSLVSGPLAELLPLREQFLSPLEIGRYNGFPADRRRFSFLSGRIAAKSALARLRPPMQPADVEIGQGVFGQPVVRGGGLQGWQVTISHHDGMAGAIAFPEEHPMGLDLELIRPQADETIATQLNAREIALLHSLPLTASAGFALGWSMKESLSKVLKCGLMAPFSIFELQSIEVSGAVFAATFANFAQYRALGVSLGPAVLSIALPRKTELDLGFLAGALAAG